MAPVATQLEDGRLLVGGTFDMGDESPVVRQEIIDSILAGLYATLPQLRAMFAGAVPFLKLMGIVGGGWQMARAALAAEKKMASGDRAFLEAKIATARFYGDHVLVQAAALRDTVVKGSSGVMALSEEQFLGA